MTRTALSKAMAPPEAYLPACTAQRWIFEALSSMSPSFTCSAPPAASSLALAVQLSISEVSFRAALLLLRRYIAPPYAAPASLLAVQWAMVEAVSVLLLLESRYIAPPYADPAVLVVLQLVMLP